MGENSKKATISIRIGVGIIFLLLAVACFLSSREYIFGFGSLAFGAGSILLGIAEKDDESSDKVKTLSYLAAVLSVLGGVLFAYNFFNSLNK